MRKHVFYEAEFCGELFRCHIKLGGPYVTGPDGDVALGITAIRHFAQLKWIREGDIERAEEVGEKSWWVVKYDAEKRLQLPSDIDTERFSQAFGIPLWQPLMNRLRQSEVFYSSLAFGGLQHWVRHHPVVAKRFASSPGAYLPDWYARAVASVGSTQVPQQHTLSASKH